MDAMRSDEPKQSHRGFTLVELMIVVVVIGIIIAFILTAAMGGIRRAEARATEALISKLEVGIADRLEALTYQQANPTGLNATPGTVPFTHAFTHAGLAEVVTTISTPSPQRAQVIAQFDMVKSELPDVFFVQYGTPAGTNYPLNFVAQRFGLTNTDSDYLLPIGSLSQGTPSTGIFGASYSVAAGIYKNICADKRGFDGLDNEGDGFVDNLTEWGGNLATLNTFVANHKHKTVRAEMLYAILVEGQGQLGSVFNRDEFKNSEIGDTDGDGLPEFVDAWGEPIYFFRWPILYPSDLQKGYAPPPGPYGSVFEARQQESLDPNQQLMAPAWWWAGSNAGQAPYATGSIPPSGAPQMSGPAIAFQSIFHALAEPLVVYQTLVGEPHQLLGPLVDVLPTQSILFEVPDHQQRARQATRPPHLRCRLLPDRFLGE